MDELLSAIKGLSPDLTADMSDEALTAIAESARQISIADGFPVDARNADGEVIQVRDMATEYLTLHLISINKSTGEGGANITSKQVSVLKVTYADTSNLQLYQRSPWGQLYLWLYNLYGNGGMTRYSMEQH